MILPVFFADSIGLVHVEPAVGAVEEHQRRSRVAAGEAFDAPEEDEVVAAGVVCFVGTLEPGAATIDQRSAAGSAAHGHIGEAVVAARGETVGQSALVGCEYVDRIAVGLAEGFQLG